MRVTAIVPAAGSGIRMSMKKGRKKPFLIIRGKPLLVHALSALEGSRAIDDIIVAVSKSDVPRCRTMVKKYGIKKVRKVIAGGRTRFDSVKKALSSLPKLSGVVVVHDGARPLVSGGIIEDTVKACRRFDASVCGVPATSTLKFVKKDMTVNMTPDRRELFIIQTPQAFKRELILKAYGARRKPHDRTYVTDDSMLVEMLGYKVKVVRGSYKNIKITTRQDLIVAEKLLGKTLSCPRKRTSMDSRFRGNDNLKD